MAPLNEENDDEDDSTLFDVKYRFVIIKLLKKSGFLATDIHVIYKTKDQNFSSAQKICNVPHISDKLYL